MRMFWSSVITISLSATLVACGGGGSDSSTVTTPIVANMSDCFQVNTGNAIRYTITPSVGTASHTPTASNTASTVYYGYSTQDRTYANSTFNGASALVRASVGTSTFASTLSPQASKSEQFLALTPTTYTVLGTKAYSSSGTLTNVLTYTGFNRTLTAKPGESQSYTYSYVNTTSTPLSASIANTLTFVAREDVSTPAGIFKNSCKLTQESSPQAITGLSGAPATVGIANNTFWFAPGWGVVKESYTNTYTDRLPASTTFTGNAISILSGSL